MFTYVNSRENDFIDNGTGNEMQTTADLLKTADAVHGAAISGASWDQWRNFGRQECQRAFREAALAAGVPDQSRDMGFVVTKCLSLSGYGS